MVPVAVLAAVPLVVLVVVLVVVMPLVVVPLVVLVVVTVWVAAAVPCPLFARPVVCEATAVRLWIGIGSQIASGVSEALARGFRRWPWIISHSARSEDSSVGDTCMYVCLQE